MSRHQEELRPCEIQMGFEAFSSCRADPAANPERITLFVFREKAKKRDAKALTSEA